VVAEEADETLFWLELLVKSELIKANLVEPLMNEYDELLRSFRHHSQQLSEIAKLFNR